MDKIKKYMDKTLTLKDLLKWMAGIVASLLMVGFTWLKTHEDRQDAFALRLKDNQSSIEIAVSSNTLKTTNMEDDIGHIHTLLANLAASDNKIKEISYQNQKTIIEQLGDIKGDIKVLKSR